MRKHIHALALVLGLGASVPALAQVNTVPQVGVNSANIRTQTFTASLLALVPAASATDFFCISGSSTKNVHVRAWDVSGTAGTLVTTPIVLVRRTSLNTGTAATSTYMKAAARMVSTNGAPTATVVAYNTTGGNPTIVDSSPVYLRTGALTLNLSGTTAAPSDHLNWRFGTAIDAYNQSADIPSGSTAQQLCLNLNAVSVSSGVLYGNIEWTED